MKLILMMLIVISMTLNAANNYTIHIASFHTKKAALTCVKKLEKEYKKHQEFSKLKNNSDSKFKVCKSGNYYLVKLEPFTDKILLQNVLDILRKKHKNIYVKKLKKEPTLNNQKIMKIENHIKVKPETIVKIVYKENKSDFIFQILFFSTPLFVLILALLLFRAKRELKEQRGKIFDDIELDNIDFDELALDLSDVNEDFFNKLIK